MSLPRAKDVPWTAGVSGLVFVLAMLSLASPGIELAIFTAWGLLYLIEGQARRLFSRPATARPPGDVLPVGHRADPPLDARDDERT
jgi:hypothetical protein